MTHGGYVAHDIPMTDLPADASPEAGAMSRRKPCPKLCWAAIFRSPCSGRVVKTIGKPWENGGFMETSWEYHGYMKGIDMISDTLW